MSALKHSMANLRSRLSTLVAISVAAVPGVATAQDNVHYLPPAYVTEPDSNSLETQSVVLSTNVTTPFVVTCARGDGTVVFTSNPISAGNPYIYMPASWTTTSGGFNSIPEHLTYGNLPSQINTALTSKGLVFTASSSFFVDMRHLTTTQGEACSTKGQVALGTDFRVGIVASNLNGNQSNAEKGNFISFMATQDNTVVDVTSIKPGVVFTGTATVTLNGQTTTPPLSVTLNAGQSYVLACATQTDDINGTRLTSSKPVAVNSGSWLGGDGSSAARDIAYDELVPVSSLASSLQSVCFGGNASSPAADRTVEERPCVVATVSNTHVFVNGNTTPEATLANPGDYYFVKESDYQSTGDGLASLMFITADQKAYLFQSTNGSPTGGGEKMVIRPSLPLAGSTRVEIPDFQYWGDNTTPTNIQVVTGVGATVTFETSDGTGGAYTPVVPSGAYPVPGNAASIAYQYAAVTTTSTDVEVSSSEPFVVSLSGGSGSRGAASAFSGYAQTPVILWSGQASGSTVSYPVALSVEQVNGYTSFQWALNGALIGGATGATYAATVPGAYTVTGANASWTSAPSPAVVLPAPLQVTLDTGAATSVSATAFDVPYLVTVSNRSGVSLGNVQVSDSIATALAPLVAGTNWSIASAPVAGAGSAFTAAQMSASFDGSASSNLLASGVTLANGAVGKLSFVVKITLPTNGTALPSQNDSATVTTTTNADTSTATVGPPVLFPLEIATKITGPAVHVGADIWSVTYEIEAQNNSSRAITGLQIAANLANAFLPLATSSWSLASPISATGAFTSAQVNSASFDGQSNQNLLLTNSEELDGVAELDAGQSGTLSFTVQFHLSSGANGYPTNGFSVVASDDEGLSPTSDWDVGSNHMTTDSSVDGTPTNDPTPFPDSAPAFTSVASASFTGGVAGSHVVTTTGIPAPAIVVSSGALPAHVTFTDNGDGTATMAYDGSTSVSGVYALGLTADNGVTPSATQSFTLTISCVPQTACPGGDDCGTVSDGCGGTVPCGTCTAPQTCGGGTPTNPNQCGCTPLTTCTGGQTCGTQSDGCSGTLVCGECGSGGGGGGVGVDGIGASGAAGASVCSGSGEGAGGGNGSSGTDGSTGGSVNAGGAGGAFGGGGGGGFDGTAGVGGGGAVRIVWGGATYPAGH